MGEMLDSLLGNKPLSDWQRQVAEEGRACDECGARAVVTPGLSDSAQMVRISCPSCGCLRHEFKPEPSSSGNVVPFRNPEQP